MGLFDAIKDSDLEHIQTIYKMMPESEHSWLFNEIKFDGSERGIHHAPELLEWVANIEKKYIEKENV